MIEEHDPSHAMAVDSQMLRDAEVGLGSIRLYRWGSNCITLGRFQDPATALVNLDRLAWSHRPTGGAAVLHGSDLTISLAVPIAMLRSGTARIAVKAVYRAMARVPLEFLELNGMNAGLAVDGPTNPGGHAAQDCFASISGCDIISSDGHKVCGCALRLTRSAALLQTSIPIAPQEIEPSTVIVGGLNSRQRPISVTYKEVEALPTWQRLNSLSPTECY